MDEFGLIDRYFRRPGGHGVVLGIGDDAALLDVPAGRQLVAAADTLVAGVHYPQGFAPADVGFRAVAVNLSDFAAMGATPRWMTLALTLPDADPAWLDDFSAGLFAAADAHGVALVGGDTTRGKEHVVSVTLLGDVEPGRALCRDGARVGDSVWVSGHPGDAAAGLALLQRGECEHALIERFRRPEPRVALGAALAGVASAAIDISDGLLADLGHVVAASGCGASLDAERLPLSKALRDACGEERARALALTGGDDYELLFTAASDDTAAVEAAARAAGVDVTNIGDIVAGSGVDCRGFDTLAEGGYRHFGGTA